MLVLASQAWWQYLIPAARPHIYVHVSVSAVLTCPSCCRICSRLQACDDKQSGAGAPFLPTCFTGAGVTLPMVLTYAIRGGQIILTENAWDAVKPIVTKHPGAVSFLSLGQHVVSDDFPQPMMLMEVMPNLLSGRSFGAPTTRRMLQPGFRDAPKPDAPMAIVFVKVCGCIQCPVRFGREGSQLLQGCFGVWQSDHSTKCCAPPSFLCLSKCACCVMQQADGGQHQHGCAPLLPLADSQA